MSCETCQTAQKIASVVRSRVGTFVRVGDGNVELVGCTAHELELTARLLDWDRRARNELRALPRPDGAAAEPPRPGPAETAGGS